MECGRLTGSFSAMLYAQMEKGFNIRISDNGMFYSVKEEIRLP